MQFDEEVSIFLISINMYPGIILEKLDELTKKVNILLESPKRNVSNEDEWIDGKEVMRILKCSERSLQTLRDKGLLPYSKPMRGTKFLYRKKDVIALCEKNFNGEFKY